MKISIISVGHKMPDWVEDACSEYRKRMPREMATQFIEIKPDKRAAGKNSDVVQAAEAIRILEAVASDYCIALDERGADMNTLALSSQMQQWLENGRNVSLIIGGADGLHASVKARADAIWRLSALTLPHGLVRILLIEQLYRAQSILHNHPYHRA